MGRRLSKVIMFFFLVVPLAQAGQCMKAGEGECIVAGGTRLDKTTGRTEYRQCWRYKYAYKCEGYALNNCQAYNEDATCQKEKVECKTQVGNWCVADNKHYLCDKLESYTRKEKRYKLPSFKQEDFSLNPKLRCNEKLRCIDGKCFDTSYAANDEFGQVSGMLAALQKMKAVEDNGKNIRLFIGNNNKCSKKAFGLNNCCKPGTGFVEKIKLSICDAGEKELRNLINENRCHYVGSHKDKVLGLKKNTNYVYCCYDNELAKEVQVQGRRQLGRGFGAPKAPDCGGFSVEQLQKIDFSQIDFSFIVKKINDQAKWGKDRLGSMKAAMENAQQEIRDEFGFIERLNQEDEEERARKKQRETHHDASSQKKPDGRDTSRDEGGI